MLSLMLLLLNLQQRRAAIAQKLAARESLQRAHDDLEQVVSARTADLREANFQLQREVAERQRAELVLRAAQDELVQTGKMAALGQLSAGITHELNQPLAAIRTLSDNAGGVRQARADRGSREQPVDDLAADRPDGKDYRAAEGIRAQIGDSDETGAREPRDRQMRSSSSTSACRRSTSTSGSMRLTTRCSRSVTTTVSSRCSSICT
jgi:signal transduction histidine kinase